MANDYSPIGPVPSGIANGTVDSTSKQLARDMRGKAYGKDVRETIARMTEWHSIRTSASEVLAAQSAASAKQSAQEVTKNAQGAIKLFNDAIRQQTQKIDNMVVDFTDYDFDSAPEILAARRGKASLGAKIDEVDAQLAQTAKKDEVRENTFDRPIDVDEMNTRTKQLFTGGAVAVVGEQAVGRENLRAKAVSPAETNFFNEGGNIYEGEINNLGLSGSGVIQTGNVGGYASSEYIFIHSDIYAKGIARISFYDSERGYISYASPTDEMAKVDIPETASFFRFSLGSNNVSFAFIAQSSSEILEPKKMTMAYKYFDEQSYLDKFFDEINAYDNLTVNNNGLNTDGNVNIGGNLGGYVSDLEEVIGTLKINNIARVVFYDENEVRIGHVDAYGFTETTKLDAPLNAKYFRYSVASNLVPLAYISGYKIKSKYTGHSTVVGDGSITISPDEPVEKTSLWVKYPTDHEYLGEKQVSLTIDDVILAFKEITENESTYTSIFEGSYFGKMKQLHDEYGLHILGVCFYEDIRDGWNLSQATTNFKEEFEENRNWLRFNFHSYSDDYTYADSSAPNAGKDNSRSLFDDYTLMRDVMKDVVGNAWDDEHTCFHYYHGNKEDIKRLREEYGLKILDGVAYQIKDRGYSYGLTSEQVNKMLEQDVVYDDYTGVYYVVKDISIERVVGAISTEGDGSVKSWLDNYEIENKKNINYLQLETHEVFFDVQSTRDGYIEMCEWANKRGYNNRFAKATDFWNFENGDIYALNNAKYVKIK